VRSSVSGPRSRHRRQRGQRRESVVAAKAGTAGLLGLVNLFSGGALLQLTIFALGIMPYITASIICSCSSW
jgi:preprotein translocase subunit SecY